MINPNKSLAQRALAGAQFLRMHAEGMADDDDFFIALMSESHAIAASAIEQLVKENENFAISSSLSRERPTPLLPLTRQAARTLQPGTHLS
ncbi:hypothetical protein ACVVKC_003109 [Salmonella enterica subsp. diarizonae serovar 16:z10:e,n,x,z15]